MVPIIAGGARWIGGHYGDEFAEAHGKEMVVRSRLGMPLPSAGVGDVALPHGFRLEAYGQAGIVGARRRDGFADGAIVIDRPVGTDESSPLRVGALAAGAVQPGAARVDVGPRMTLRLPDVGEGSRIALDWRQRVAGGIHQRGRHTDAARLADALRALCAPFVRPAAAEKTP